MALVVTALLGAGSGAAFAAEAGEPAGARTAVSGEVADASAAEARRLALMRASNAVVGVEVTAVAQARSIATLGRSRRGSGVVIGDDGLVLTIGYLILEADHTDLVLDDGRRIPARVVAYDAPTGFGLLQSLAPLALPTVRLGDSSALSAAQPLLVVSGGKGGDLGVAQLVSRRPFSGTWEYHIDDALFTAPARDHHSGAGLFNIDGELVGIGSLIVGNAAGPDAPPRRGNMFVPVSLLGPILDELRKPGAAPRRRPWLGINCVEFEGHIRVLRTSADGPAEAAGLRSGDTIVAIDGTAVSDLASFYRALWADGRPDREVALDVRRAGETRRVSVQAVDRQSMLRRPEGV